MGAGRRRAQAFRARLRPAGWAGAREPVCWWRSHEHTDLQFKHAVRSIACAATAGGARHNHPFCEPAGREGASRSGCPTERACERMGQLCRRRGYVESPAGRFTPGRRGPGRALDVRDEALVALARARDAPLTGCSPVPNEGAAGRVGARRSPVRGLRAQTWRCTPAQAA